MHFLKIVTPANFKLYLRYSVKPLQWRIKTSRHSWIFGRIACMGHDVLSMVNPSLPVLNVQKGRVDYLLDAANAPDISAHAFKVAPFLERQDILPLIAQESDLTWLKLPPPSVVFMDSYSELTDQLFSHRRKGWRFCCNYSDLSHSNSFRAHFKEDGLLPPENILVQYRNFFRMVRKRWQNVPVIFLHFPVKLDNREKFRARYKNIYECITRISKEFQPFFSLTVDESVVDWPEVRIPDLKNFPYHYNKNTYQAFADKVRETGVFDALPKRI